MGAGGRYELTTADIAKLKGKFAAWQKAKKESAAKEDAKPEVKAAPAKNPAKVAAK